jgi:hypothetical protein
MERHFKKWFSWPSKLCCPLKTQNSAVPLKRSGKKLFFNFEHYDLANGEE